MLNFFRKISSDTKALPLGVKLIAFVLFLRTFGWGFVDPFFSIFVSDFSGNYAEVGGLISIMNLASLVAMFPLMRLADRMRDTMIMRDAEILYIISVVFYLLAGFTEKLSFLTIAFVLNGIALPFMIVGAETYIRKYTNSDNDTRSFAFYTAINYLGWILGMLIGAYTVQYYGLKMMFLFVLPSAIAGLFVLRHIHEKGLRSIIWGIRKYFHNKHDFQMILDDCGGLSPRTMFFLLLSFFDGILVMFSFIFIPLFALTIDLGLREIALLMAVMYTPFVFSYVISELTEGLRRMQLIAMGLFIGAFAFILLSFIIQSLWVTMLAVMISVSLSIIRPAYNGMLTRLTPRRMLGEITSLNNLSLRLGYVVGPILTGLIADRYSLQAAFFAIAIFAFVLAILALFFRSFELPQSEA